MTQIQEISPVAAIKFPLLHGAVPSPLVSLVRHCLKKHEKLVHAILANVSAVRREHEAAHYELMKRRHRIKV